MPKRKESTAQADNSLAGLFGGGSLTASLFGGNDDFNDGIFGSNTTSFDKAVRDRVEENKAKAKKKVKTSSLEEEGDAEEASDKEILARRREQSEIPLVNDITCPPIYPANEETTSKAGVSDEVPPLPVDVKVQEVVDVVRAQGFAVVQNIVSKTTLDVIAKCAHEIQEQVWQALNKRKIPWRADDDAETFRFYEVASRCAGRLDLRYETSNPPFSDPCIVENKSLMPIIHSLLGGSTAREETHMPILVYVGLIISLPGSDNQPWHQDGMPLFTETSDDNMPPYALNVFLPLTDDDASLESGPTEFIPASHRLPEDKVMEAVDAARPGRKQQASDEQLPDIASPILRQGDALIYDYRVCHRGTSNLTHLADKGEKDGKGRVRKILYLMYARPWFKEHLNFGTEKLFDDS